MNKVFRIKFLFAFLFSWFIFNSASAQFVANAGVGKAICPGTSFSLGGTPSASGGKLPYTYSWSPSNFLSNPSSANPTCTPSTDVYYTLTVTDDSGAVRTSSVNITMTYLQYVNAGRDTSVCVGGFALIGGSDNVAGKNVTYSWLPTTGLSDSASPQPIATPIQTTTYSLTANFPNCPPKVTKVTITIIPTPLINAGIDTTMKEGETATLHASGGFFYNWYPVDSTFRYPNTATPNAFPKVTTTYYLVGKDATGKCTGVDSVVVNIIPDNEVTFYNTFTPNEDGNNDTWYIGNIEKYPNNHLEIYNRYGKLVFQVDGYKNVWDSSAMEWVSTWDGKAFGEKLPAATYFYIMDLGDGGKKYHGTVTIVN